jgi:O-antigen ligase
MKDKIFCLSVYAVLIVFPFFQPVDVMRHTAAALCGMLLLLAIATCAVFNRPRKVRITVADVLLCAFLMVCSVGKTFAIVQCLCLMLGYIAFRMLPANRIPGLLATMMLSCVLQSVYGFLQYTERLEPLHQFQLLTGSFSNQSHLASFLSIGAIVSVGICVFPKTLHDSAPSARNLAVRILLFVWFMFILWLTSARAAWVGVFFGTVLLLYFRYVQSIRPYVAKFARPVIIVICVLMAGTAGYALYRYKKDSADGRLLIWKVTARMISRHPIVGNGADAFRRDYMYAQAEHFALHPDDSARQLADNTVSPFNEYLKIWYEHGIIGISLLAVLFITLMCVSLPPERVVLKALLIAMGIVCAFSYPLDIWCLRVYILIVVALLARYSVSLYAFRPLIILRCLFLFCLCGIAFFVCYDSYQVRRCVKILANPTDLNAQLAVFASASPALTGNYEYHHLYGKLLMRSHEDDETITQMRIASELSPSSHLCCNMGDLYMKKQQYPEAEYLFWQAHNMVPSQFVPLHRLMQLYVKTGQADKAKELAVMIIQQPVKVKTNVTDQIKKEANRIIQSLITP